MTCLIPVFLPGFLPFDDLFLQHCVSTAYGTLSVLLLVENSVVKGLVDCSNLRKRFAKFFDWRH